MIYLVSLFNADPKNSKIFFSLSNFEVISAQIRKVHFWQLKGAQGLSKKEEKKNFVEKLKVITRNLSVTLTLKKGHVKAV